jgi:hypothetical protein
LTLLPLLYYYFIIFIDIIIIDYAIDIAIILIIDIIIIITLTLLLLLLLHYFTAIDYYYAISHSFSTHYAIDILRHYDYDIIIIIIAMPH